MIDIHTHIIPGIDDGSSDMMTSLSMAELAAENGTDAIIATPHCNQPGLYENYASEELSERAEKRDKACGDPDRAVSRLRVVRYAGGPGAVLAGQAPDPKRQPIPAHRI